MNPDRAVDPTRILIRAANWVGDAVMSLPALRAVRQRFPQSHIAVLARPWVAELYAREQFPDEVIEYPSARGFRDLPGKWRIARRLRDGRFDWAVLLPNSFESAAVVRLAGIEQRIGYDRDARGGLLTHAIAPPEPGEIPRFESYYYLELLRRAGWIEELPDEIVIRLDGIDDARAAGDRRFREMGIDTQVVGISPGAAYGKAKRWLPEHFAEAAAKVAGELGAPVILFGSAGERALCAKVESMEPLRRIRVHNLAGETTLGAFIELAAACSVFLTNDSGAMHIAAALGVPTVAVFGATDYTATGPTGERTRVVREPVECSPCLLRECPIDHRCMKWVPAERVAEIALDLLK